MFFVGIHPLQIVTSAYSNSYFGIGTNPLHIYNTYCRHFTDTLRSCSMNRIPYSYSYCNNYNEAGVKCEGSLK